MRNYYPTPVRLHSDPGLFQFHPFRIWNAEGRVVLSKEMQSGEEVDLDAGYPSGLYLVDVIQEGTRKTLRLVKH